MAMQNAAEQEQELQEEEEIETKQSSKERNQQVNQSYEKIKAFIKKSNQQEKLEFT